MIISYERADNDDIKVRLNHRVVGRIKLASGGGYYYLPKGSKIGGRVYPTSGMVKRSLESDDGNDDEQGKEK